MAQAELATPGSCGRGRDREPRSRLPYHVGTPLGSFRPLFLEPREFAVELPDLFAQRRALLLESVPFRLGGLRRLSGLVVFVQHPAQRLEYPRTLLHPLNHPLPIWSPDHTWHGLLSLVLRGLPSIVEAMRPAHLIPQPISHKTIQYRRRAEHSLVAMPL